MRESPTNGNVEVNHEMGAEKQKSGSDNGSEDLDLRKERMVPRKEEGSRNVQHEKRDYNKVEMPKEKEVDSEEEANGDGWSDDGSDSDDDGSKVGIPSCNLHTHLSKDKKTTSCV